MDAHELFVPHSKSIVQKDRYLGIKVSQKQLQNQKNVTKLQRKK